MAYQNQPPGQPPRGYSPQVPPPQGYPPQGYPPQGYPPQGYHGAVPQPGNGIAVAAMILGILSIALFFVPFLNFILGVLGLIMGVVGMKKATHAGGKGKGMAIAGLVTGIVGTLWGLFVAAIIVTGTKVHL